MVTRSDQAVPKTRIHNLNGAPVLREQSYVLYWMVSARRAHSNFALDHAVALAKELDKPLIVLEPLRCGYPWASDRFHRFVIEGMVDNERAFENTAVLYYPYVEPKAGEGRGLLEKLASQACAIVTDDSPMFFIERMVNAAASKIAVRLEAVDSNGLLPIRKPGRAFNRAYDFRRYLQSELAPHLFEAPHFKPKFSGLQLRKRMPSGISARWPRAELDQLLQPGGMNALPIDHTVSPVPYSGGSKTARTMLREFVKSMLANYLSRNQPEVKSASGLSPYLHFGHVSAHEIFHAVAKHEDWTPERIRGTRKGQREGWWRASPQAENFLDQLVTWRELGFNFCTNRPDYESFDALPSWAVASLDEHASDKRPHLYTLEQFDRAATHDPLWNAAQQELRQDGRIHNYLRMLWGKKILHWSESPRAALEIMVHLNNRYATDGRDPNSYSGIFWVLGRFDRAWGPERPVFGKIRYMASANTRRKLRVNDYIHRWTEQQGAFAFNDQESE